MAKMNLFVKKAAELYALGAIDCEHLRYICSSEERYYEAVSYAYEYISNFDVADLAEAIELLQTKGKAKNMEEAGRIIHVRINKGDTLIEIIKSFH